MILALNDHFYMYFKKDKIFLNYLGLCELQKVFLIINSLSGFSSGFMTPPFSITYNFPWWCSDCYSGVVFTVVLFTCFAVGFFVYKRNVLHRKVVQYGMCKTWCNWRNGGAYKFGQKTVWEETVLKTECVWKGRIKISCRVMGFENVDWIEVVE
jgi:hypothetical protein